jgi:hypothetical protein
VKVRGHWREASLIGRRRSVRIETKDLAVWRRDVARIPRVIAVVEGDE